MEKLFLKDVAVLVWTRINLSFRNDHDTFIFGLNCCEVLEADFLEKYCTLIAGILLVKQIEFELLIWFLVYANNVDYADILFQG